jgi:catalase
MAMGPEEVVDRINAAFKKPKGYRTLHAKGRFYDATFTATPEATALTTAEHLNGKPCPVVLRWSNGGGHPKVPDPAPDVRGMAVSFRPVNGATTDLLGQTSPRFPARTPEEFVAITEVGAKPATLPLFALRHPRMAASFPRTLPGLVSPHSFAEATFYPIHAYGWIAADGTRSWVRYRLVPQATKADRLEEKFEGKDRLSEEIRARLARGPVKHDLWIDVAGDGDDPHDPTSVWKHHRSFIGGTIEATGEAAVDPEADGKKVVFDPARVVPGIELSEDPILLFRPSAYSVSVDRR